MRLKIYNEKTIAAVEQFRNLPEDYKALFSVISKVLAFRTNNYIIEQLIDWSNPLQDPLFKINFFPENALAQEQIALLSTETSPASVEAVRHLLNPDSDNNSYDVPLIHPSAKVEGVQHKFKNICIVFPRKGQQCHSYCTFCFRWAQFIEEDNSIKHFATTNDFTYLEYIKANKNLKEILFTGGDPLFMNTRNIIEYISPLLTKDFDHIESIRIGTKSLAFWPYRFITDHDASSLLQFFELIGKSGKHLSIMAHFNHWRELSTTIVQNAIRKIQATGAVIRTQSPVLKGINDSAEIWTKMLNEQIRLGCIPYYMLVERKTGTSHAYAVSLAKTLEIFKAVFANISGLAKTIRGPIMSTFYGKIMINDVVEIESRRYFLLSFIRARVPSYDGKYFFAQYDKDAQWLSDLKSMDGKKFFFEQT